LVLVIELVVHTLCKGLVFILGLVLAQLGVTAVAILDQDAVHLATFETLERVDEKNRLKFLIFDLLDH
jgi:hypothetical protein